MELPFSHL